MSDPTQRVRLLYPPFVFFLVLASGLALDSYYAAKLSLVFDAEKDRGIGLAAVLAVVGAATLPIGFLLSGAGALLAKQHHAEGKWEKLLSRLLGFLAGRIWAGAPLPREDPLESNTLEGLPETWLLDVPKELSDRDTRSYVGVAFDHGLLRESLPGVHAWVTRLWTTTRICITCYAATVAGAYGVLILAALRTTQAHKRWEITCINPYLIVWYGLVGGLLWWFHWNAKKTQTIVHGCLGHFAEYPPHKALERIARAKSEGTK